MSKTPAFNALDCALVLARNGIPVVPIRSDKRPYTQHGVKDATSEQTQIEAWAKQYPGCNWGMACGEASGITVLDIDPRNGGRPALAHLTKPVSEGGWGDLPETVTSRTGGEESGWHYWFRHPEGDWGDRIRNVSIVPGIDVKTTGGYIIVPGSKTHGFYTWVEGLAFGRTGLAPLPGWIAKMASSSGTDFDRDATGKIPVGQRNDYLHSIAGTLRRRGLDEEEIYHALVGMGTVSCDYGPHVDGEYRKIASSASKYEPTDPALKGMEVDPDARIEARRSERAILGRILDTGDRDDPVIQRAMSELRESYFDEPHGKAAFQKLRHIWQQGATPTLENVIAGLEADGYEIPDGYTDELRREGGRIMFEGDVTYHVGLMRSGYLFREGSRVVGDGLVRLRESRGDAKAIVSAVGSRLMTVVEEGADVQLLDAHDLTRLAEEVYAGAKDGVAVMNTPTGWRSIDEEVIGLPNSELTILAARPGQMKPIKKTTPTLTARGWVPHGDLVAGDRVVAVDGSLAEVLATEDKGVLDVYRVDFSDGTSVVCSADHLWETQTRPERSRGVSSVKCTATISASLTCKGGSHPNHSVARPGPALFPEADLPIEPYLLGVLIGDGCLTSGSPEFVNGEDDVARRAEIGLPRGVTMRSEVDDRQDGTSRTRRVLTAPGRKDNPLLTLLRTEDLWGKRAWEKAIPEVYMTAAVEQRLSLLQGLCDTDGRVNAGTRDGTSPNVIYTTTSERLAEQVLDLARSLGAEARLLPRPPTHYVHDGERRLGRSYWDVSMTFYPTEAGPGLRPVSSAKHAQRYRPPARPLRKYVKDVVAVGSAECNCISVDHPRRLYVVDGYNATHNTAFTMQMMRQCAGRWKETGDNRQALYISAEMSGQQMGLRFMCSEAAVNSKGVRQGRLTSKAEQAWYAGQERFKGLPIFVDEMAAPTPEAIAARAHSIHAVNPVGLVVIDYVELLSPSEALDGRAKSNPVLVVSEAVKQAKLLAKSLGCPVVLISQLSRDVEKRANATQEPIPRPSDLRWASMAEQTANQIIMLYYPWNFYKNGLRVCYSEEPDKNYYEVHFQKNRDGEVGVVPMRVYKHIGKILDRDDTWEPPSWDNSSSDKLDEAEDQPSFMREHYPETPDDPEIPVGNGGGGSSTPADAPNENALEAGVGWD